MIARCRSISIQQINEYIEALNKHTGLQYRLPTQNEWEYAASGGAESQGYKYAGSDNLKEVAHYTKNSYSFGYKGTLKPNEIGLYDMSGNVWELCYNPEEKKYLIKGGSIYMKKSDCEISYTYTKISENKLYEDVGVRLVLDSK